jgi:hypothetical protein
MRCASGCESPRLPASLRNCCAPAPYLFIHGVAVLVIRADLKHTFGIPQLSPRVLRPPRVSGYVRYFELDGSFRTLFNTLTVV